ncbi:hypothetical protein [Halarcobacter ebronensis]|uniref:Uncharacterized protein n=1 Tax=Halarcobacter ebronensis TaxID=1462615 RepID=A0A4Q1AX32_9BACT|nr:hypothetical protein [Halarcobacter ebronensis]QKF82561.1 hypothetical protein AEBR_2084 [Halarcobacter ebronensis]RXK07426.1 hypothetical protein CRV07_02885 [Halarcobacter ebronensis]
MLYKDWIKRWFLFIFFIPFLVIVNYLVDPYEIYMNDFFNLEKTKQAKKIRLSKIEHIKIIKPKVLVMGTSRVENGFDPKHKYFEDSGYNFGLSGASMYEISKSFEFIVNQIQPKKVLLVLDWIMFNSYNQVRVKDFNEYFNKDFNKYKYLISSDMTGESFVTILDNFKNKKSSYLDNGQLKHDSKANDILKHGGQKNVMIKEEAFYYKKYTVQNNYGDTKRDAFLDFEDLLNFAFSKDIQLEIIFGPSHIRQWEAFSYYHDYNLLLNWKKKVVLTVDRLSHKYNKKSFNIVDFSIYNKYTSEKIPSKKEELMKYYWEGSHYRNSLGQLVLDFLYGDIYDKELGVVLTKKNIDEHLKKLLLDRKKYIDSKEYKFKINGYLKLLK